MCELVNICYRTLFNLSFFEFIMVILVIILSAIIINFSCGFYIVIFMILEGVKYIFNLVSPFLLLVLREVYLFVACYFRKYYINFLPGAEFPDQNLDVSYDKSKFCIFLINKQHINKLHEVLEEEMDRLN
jgi:hypothetical protein